MRLIELHVLQSFPVSCLNRDDVGAPKTAVFGGVTRARISSQCLKRAIRLYAQDDLKSVFFGGQRSKKIAQDLAETLVGQHHMPAADAAQLAARACESILSKEKEGDKPTGRKRKAEATESPEEAAATSGLLFLSRGEVTALADALSKAGGQVDAKSLRKIVQEALTTRVKDAADIAIFGRMVANAADITLEGAAMFSHAISTHKADNDIDFFTAVDDMAKRSEDTGSAHMGTTEFTSACYYRYAALNLDMLADHTHLAVLSPDERRAVVATFIRATLLAVPSARRNSMNANTFPAYVLGIVKDQGQPLQLVNAFENPVRPRNGLVEASVAALKQHHEQMKETWGIQTTAELAIPDTGLEDFCERIVVHVN
ncbi:MAG: CRISPR system Cascade subunit CasC [Lentisphaerae bacterium ADurb.BinA184]|nr:MAG: CRISPR system Cascade subunit CasC [Lentisphaerae bacterium ADurb.BinA184]